MSWDDEAAGWDDNPAVRAYSAGAARSLEEVLEVRGHTLEGARVLDFGCGTGLLTADMARRAAEVVALDVSEAMCAVLRGKDLPNVHVVAGELADRLDDEHLQAGSFDLVTCSSVCAFVDDYPATAALLASRLAPGGVFVQWDWPLDPDAEEPFGLTRESIEAALVAAGLEDVVVDVGFTEPYEGMVMAPWRGVGRKPG